MYCTLLATSFVFLFLLLCVSGSINLTDDLDLTFSTRNHSVLRSELGISVENTSKILNKCKEIINTEEGIFCVDEKDKIALSIERIKSSLECYDVIWAESYDSRDCFELGERYWFGGGEVDVQRWPLVNEDRKRAAYITGDFFHYEYGSVIESLWLSSDGFVVYSDPTLDLEVSLNESSDGLLCLNILRSYQSRPLQYTLCSGRNVKDSARYLYKEVWKHPEKVPDKIMMAEPIWSTWAFYKADINQSLVLDYAKQVEISNIGASHIEIDDKWEDCYGSLRFDSKKFPDPSGMVEELKKNGFRSTFWVHPFVNEDCDAFNEGKIKGYFVHNGSTEGPPQLVKWWNGVGGYIDTTNPLATDWYVRRLMNLKSEYGFQGYKFDAGEASWMPPNSILYDSRAGVNSFTTFYVGAASKLGDLVEVRSSHNSQNRAVYVRMMDKNSVWGYEDGLKTLIPTTLLFSIFGYPFVLPDMIGGNNAGVSDDGLPERELYLKWLLATALLPVMQFSIPPWSYDKEMVEIARDAVELHRKHADLFISLAENAVLTGEPIIRPLWWLDPEDSTTFTIDSEFLVGDRLLVAPILEKGATSRDIYLPKGNWRDELCGNEVVGPVWLRGYNSSVTELPHFRALYVKKE